MNIAIIGGGNMGEAFAKGIHEKCEHLVVCERNLDRHAIFTQLNVAVSQTHEDIVRDADIVILAVKPHDMEDTCASIAPILKPNALILSIAAGVTIDSLKTWLKKNTGIVRVMPNLLAVIGKSVSVWYAPHASNAEKELTQSMLESLGTAYELMSEEAIDQATAISGCGPAYVWYVLDGIIAAGKTLGLPPRLAHDLATQTLLGSAIFAGETRKSDFNPADMCQKVASKGGSTEKALAVFEERGLKKIIAAGIEAAYERAKEMGK